MFILFSDFPGHCLWALVEKNSRQDGPQSAPLEPFLGVCTIALLFLDGGLSNSVTIKVSPKIKEFKD